MVESRVGQANTVLETVGDFHSDALDNSEGAAASLSLVGGSGALSDDDEISELMKRFGVSDDDDALAAAPAAPAAAPTAAPAAAPAADTAAAGPRAGGGALDGLLGAAFPRVPSHPVAVGSRGTSGTSSTSGTSGTRTAVATLAAPLASGGGGGGGTSGMPEGVRLLMG